MQEIRPMAINTISVADAPVPASLAGLPTPEPSAAIGLRAPLPPPARRAQTRPLFRLADRIFGKPLCITRDKCDVIMQVLGPRLRYEAHVVPAVPLSSIWDDDEDDDLEAAEGAKPYAVNNGIARIAIEGTLVKRSSGLDALSGLTSYESLRSDIGAAMADADVQGICFDVDSPGGEASGCADLADYIYGLRGTKPMYAVCNDSMCSAAYWLSSSADRIYTTRDGMVGSIGVYMLHVDASAADAAEGLKYTYIQAGARKTDGNPHEPLSDAAEGKLQVEVDRVRDMFISSVARNRGVSADGLLALEGDVQFAQAAIPMLADRVGTYDDAVRELLASLPAPPEKEDPDEEQQPDEEDDLMEMVAAAPITADTITITAGTYTIAGMLPFSEVRQEAIQSIVTAREKGLYGHSIKECFHLISQAGQARWMDIEAADKARPVLAIRIFGTSEIIPARRAIPIDDKFSSYEQVPVADSRTIRCLVAPYNRMSLDLGGFREMYSIGCFAAWLASGADACAVLQHDPMYILGRQSADTAKFYETDTGLWFECEAPATQWASDLLTSMRRGDVTGSSAAFFIDHARWEYRNGTKIRIIEKARLVEGSIANFALYPDSTASVISPTSAAASVPAAVVATPDGHVNQLAAARLRLLRLA